MLSLQQFAFAAFDLDNTLIDRDAAFAAAWSQWLNERRDLSETAEAFLARVIDLDNEGYRPRSEFCEKLAEYTGWKSGTALSAWTEVKKIMLGAIKPDEALCRKLGALGRQIPLAIVSNGSTEMQRRKIRAAGLEPIFPIVLISEEIGISKPDRAIFDLALSSAGAPAGESVFVGDNPGNDVRGAQQAGLRACWVSRGRACPENLVPDLVVDSIHELLER